MGGFLQKTIPSQLCEPSLRGAWGASGDRVIPKHLNPEPQTREVGQPVGNRGQARSLLQTLIIYKFGFYQNCSTFTRILLIKTVLCSKFAWTKFTNYECFGMRTLLMCVTSDVVLRDGKLCSIRNEQVLVFGIGDVMSAGGAAATSQDTDLRHACFVSEG